MNPKAKNRNEKIVLLILTLLVIPLVIAANDPGHDTLYVEEQGDSDLNGTLNITENLTVNGGRIRQPGGLTLYGDDSTPSPGVTYISGTSGNHLYLDGQGNIYIKFLSGGDMVYIGGSTATDLNVSGALHIKGPTAQVGGTNICLENGTDCPASLGGANITGKGDNGYLAKFTGGGTIANSLLYEAGSTVTFNANISMPTHFFIGASATSTGSNSLALGTFAQATNTGATALGPYSNATGQYSVSIGDGSDAVSDYSTSIGGQSNSINTSTVAIGYQADASGQYGVAIGDNSDATKTYSVSIGTQSNALNTSTVAIGSSANAQAEYSTAIGDTANVTEDYATAIAFGTDATGYGAMALGAQAQATADYTVAIGYDVNATAQDALVFGRSIENSMQNSSLFGGHLRASGDINTTGGDVCIVGGNCLSTASADGNNYTEAISFSTSGATETLNLDIVGRANLTASFTDSTDDTVSSGELDGVCGTNSRLVRRSGGTWACFDDSVYYDDSTIGNCSVSQSCLNVLYDTNASDFATPGTCSGSQFVQNATSSGVECATPSLATAGGWSDLGTVVNLTTPSDNVSTNELFVDNTNSRVGIGTTSPSELLHITSASASGSVFWIENTGGDDASMMFNADRDWIIQNDGDASLGTADYFQIRDHTAEKQRLTIDISGNIGISDTSPQAKLHVNASSNQLRISYDDSNYGNLSVTSDGNLTISATNHVIIDLS